MCTDISAGSCGYWNPCLPTLVATVGVPKIPEGEGCEASVELQGVIGIVDDHPCLSNGPQVSFFCEIIPLYRLKIKSLGSSFLCLA